MNIKTGNLKLKLEPRMVGECDLVAPLLLLLVLLVQPSDSYRDYGFPFSITCFTCMNGSSNAACNQVAIDRPCPDHLPVCRTQHNISHGRTISVRKECSAQLECEIQPGCYRDKHLQVCISCCSESYCNEDIPWTLEQAKFLRSSSNLSNQPTSDPHLPIFLLVFYNLILGKLFNSNNM